jgi:hypothetical protein
MCVLADVVEALSAQLHDIYQQEAKRQGDVRHHDAYSALKESTKEFDRVLARFIVKHASIESVTTMLADPLESTT